MQSHLRSLGLFLLVVVFSTNLLGQDTASLTGTVTDSTGAVSSVTALIEGALQTLSMRWDQSKGFTREPTTPLDGTARVKCLKRLAFGLGLEPSHEQQQFYGILVPVEGRWGFVHKTLQDYLAAQYWVESGAFAEAVAKDRVKLDSRTAYAACLANDATPLMLRALNEREGLPVIMEILMNDPFFDHPKVTNALIAFYARYKGEHYHRAMPERIECSLPDPFFIQGSSKFLDYIVQACAPVRSKTTDTLATYAITELVRRGVPLSHKTWEACVKSYPSDRFSFYAGGTLRLVDVPHA